MKTNLKLATSDPPRSPERDALAEKIADLAAARQRSAAIKAAILTAAQAVSTAIDAVDQATASIEKAKINAAQYLTEQALGTAGAAPMTIKEAGQAGADARDNLDAAQSALAQLKKQEAPADNSVLFSELALKDRIADVFKAELPVEQLLADFATVRRDYTMHAHVLSWLESKGALPRDALRAEPREWAAAAQAPWEAAAAALASDADAPLPV